MRFPDNPEANKRLHSLANRMKALRQDQGLTIGELATASGLSEQTIQRFEEQGQPVKFTELHKMATVLGQDLALHLTVTKE